MFLSHYAEMSETWKKLSPKQITLLKKQLYSNDILLFTSSELRLPTRTPDRQRALR